MAANTDQEIAPLNENNDQPKDLVIDIPEEDLEPGPECCIYKVPSRFREANQKAFTPQLISIGPIHHGNTTLARMERQKQRYYKKFCQRTFKETSEETLKKFQSHIKAHVSDIRRCYDTQFISDTELEVSNFEQMILFDAVFIIELFLRNSEKVNDFLFDQIWLKLELQSDLLLLENQLPFFILEALYKLAFAASNRPFFDLTCLYFGLKKDQTFGKEGIKHFIDLTRSILVRNCPSVSDERIDHMYNATMLYDAGVKFNAIGDDIVLDDLLNVKFVDGVLQIPCFSVNYKTETLCRNLIVFEQCHYPDEAYFCSYIYLLDKLVETTKDVDLLIKKKILFNVMGSSAAVTDMINNLPKEVASVTRCYDKMAKELNDYYDNSWNRRWTTLKHVYFNNLWRGTATVAAFIVVVLTLTQTVFAILE